MAAIYVLVAFGILVAVLIASSGKANSEHWSRLIYIFTGVEALVFSAAGALFGTVIQTRHVMAAESRADDAREGLEQERDRATKAERQASAGVALRHAIDAEREVHTSSRRSAGSGGLTTEKVGSQVPTAATAPTPPGGSEALERLAALSHKLFDDESDGAPEIEK